MIYQGNCIDVMRRLIDEGVKVQSCVTSPPYWGLRDYGHPGQIGLENTPEEYVEKMVEVFSLVYQLLKDDGTLWLNLGDSYAASGKGGNPEDSEFRMQASNAGSLIQGRRALPQGYKMKDLVGIPWMTAFALRNNGWYLRSDIIWHKPNPMPESVIDRPTKSHEYIFLLTKNKNYYYNSDAIREPQKEESLERLKSGWDGNKKRDWPGGQHNNFDKYMGKSDEEIAALPGRNKRSVWTITTKGFDGAHFATFPPDLIEPCILAGARAGDIILDPFNGSGTTGMVAYQHGREYIGIEINPAYIELAEKRMTNVQVDMLTSFSEQTGNHTKGSEG